MKAWHIGLRAGFVAVGLVLVVTGAGGFAFLVPLGCVAMMAMMFWMMGPGAVQDEAAWIRSHHAAGR